MKRIVALALAQMSLMAFSMSALGQLKPVGPSRPVKPITPPLISIPVSTVNVLTQHNDIGRTGANLDETILNTTNVNVNTFGKLFAAPVDANIYAQPLYVSQLMINGVFHNVLYVCTENNSVYALDADTGVQLWQSPSLGPPVPTALISDRNIIGGIVGITATPVIDLSTKTMYLEARSLESGVYIHRVHALDLTTGAEKFNGPTVITATAPGIGYDNANGVITFNPQRQHSRPGLLLLNGVVYMGFASLDDLDYYHGWLIGYQAHDLSKQVAVFCTTPNGEEGGIWQSGNGLSSDGTSIFCMVGNGTADIQTGGTDYGMCFLRLNQSLVVQDWFLTYNFAGLNSEDSDVGTGGPVLVPGVGIVAGGAKGGDIYVVNEKHFGGFNATNNSNILEDLGGLGHLFSSPVVWSSTSGTYVYLCGAGNPISMFQVTKGKLATPPMANSPISSPGGYTTGATLAISAKGTNKQTGILWATMPIGDGTNNSIGGSAYAFNASSPSTELWDTTQNAARDGLGNWAKFCAPTIANGHVYIATDSGYVLCYGLLSEQKAPLAPTGLTATPGNATVTLNWTGVTGAATYNVYRSTTSGGEGTTPIATGVIGTQYVDNTPTNGITYYYQVAGVSIGGVGLFSNEASATPLASLDGYLSGSTASTPNSVNLTALGTTDWAHWGVTGDLFDDKATGGGQISNFTKTGQFGVAYTPPPTSGIAFSWTDGKNMATVTNTATGVYVPGAGSTLSVTVPADNVTTHTVQVYLFGYFAPLGVNAHLSDNSNVDYNTTIPWLSGVNNEVVTLTYRSGSPGQTLTITITANSVTQSNGGVGLESVTLQ